MLWILAGAIRSDVEVELLDARNPGSQSTTAANDYSDVGIVALCAVPSWEHALLANEPHVPPPNSYEL